MALLAERPETRIGGLTARLGQTTVGTTRVIDALEAQGYARRLRLPDADGCQVHVALTPDGASALWHADRAFLDQVASSLVSLSADERSTLARLLQTVAAPSATSKAH